MEQSIVSRSGVTLSKNLIDQAETWEELLGLGMEIRSYKDTSSWLLGLLALKVETKFGEDSIGKYAREIGISASSLRVYRWTVKQFLTDNPQFVPPERLAFGVLSSIAKLPADERQKFLEGAEDDGMSVERARVEVQKQQGKPVRPLCDFEYCKIHNLWTWVPKNPQEWEPPHE